MRKVKIVATVPRQGYRQLVLLARAKRVSIAEYVRRALADAARADGIEIDLTVLPPRGGVSVTDLDAGER